MTFNFFQQCFIVFSASIRYLFSLVAQMVKHLTTMRETQVQSLGWEDPLEKEMATHSSTLGRRSVVGYSPWGRKESDTTERLHFFRGFRPIEVLVLDSRKS